MLTSSRTRCEFHYWQAMHSQPRLYRAAIGTPPFFLLESHIALAVVMASVNILFSVFAIIAILSNVSAQSEGTCQQACNCQQLNSVQSLTQLIDSRFAAVAGKL